YLEHRFFPSFGSSLHTTYWKAKFRGKLSFRETTGDPQKGDVIVIQPTPRKPCRPHGDLRRLRMGA
ncbi:hypothetical protein, partial [Paraburkholderia nemoris]|uniref:hypothetical protein n=1 Tax=Paraburkholderia nemoris TaxID=2793076 RepID=UPI001B8ACC9D